MPSHLRAALLLPTTAALLFCQSPPGQADLTKAYDALKNRDYDLAIELFRKGIALQPANPGLHKDLAYTLLKTGDNPAARDEFAAAQKLNPQDESAALEFAFLAFETKQPIQPAACSISSVKPAQPPPGKPPNKPSKTSTSR